MKYHGFRWFDYVELNKIEVKKPKPLSNHSHLI